MDSWLAGWLAGWLEFAVHAKWYGKVVRIRFLAWQGQSLAETEKEVGGLALFELWCL